MSAEVASLSAASIPKDPFTVSNEPLWKEVPSDEFIQERDQTLHGFVRVMLRCMCV